MSSKDKFTPPKYLNIAGKRVKIKVKKDLKTEDGTEAHGLYHDCIIELNEDTPEDYKVAILLHEAVHAALTITGVAEMLDIKLEEAICRALELLAPNIYFKSKK